MSSSAPVGSLWAEDKPLVLLSFVDVLGFLFAAIGLTLVPLGNASIYQVHYEDIALHWFSLVFTLLVLLMACYGSVSQRRDVLLMAQAYLSLATALLIVCGHWIVVLTHDCRACPVTIEDVASDGTTTYTSVECPAFKSGCLRSMVVFLFGSLIMVLCQFALFIVIADRREKLRYLVSPKGSPARILDLKNGFGF